MERYILDAYQFWTTSELFDQDTRKELEALRGQEDEITDRFYKQLSFGTGGLRGVIGAGTNRMNRYTVRKATQGLANYILAQDGQQKGVAIAHDSRHFSDVFALETALCLNANGIQTYLFDSLRPTPELSFALRTLGCIAGVVITASHNPAEYNGYKVYWEDGAQITPPRDTEIITEVNRVTDYAAIRTMDRANAEKQGLFHFIGDEMDTQYMEALKKLVLHPESIRNMATHVKIVYTPLHGTGNLPVRRILAELGFSRVYVGKEQELPDGAFPTIPYPNPEDKRAFALALKLAEETDADLVLATDPDADRLGIYAKDTDGTYQAFSGNMSGMLICEYELSQKKALGLLPKNGAVVTTIVSSKMARRAAQSYGVDCIETLTGFKFIGEQIKKFEQDGSHTYVFGFEESYGCLLGTHARDKDAVVAVMALCEAAAYYKAQGITLCQQMYKLYEKYGYYKEALVTRTFKGITGQERMKQIMAQTRNNPPASIGGKHVLTFCDYKKQEERNMMTGEVKPTSLPYSDVIYFELEDDAWFCIRPSGTEPKIKYYAGVRGKNKAQAEEQLEQLKQAMDNE